MWYVLYYRLRRYLKRSTPETVRHEDGQNLPIPSVSNVGDVLSKWKILSCNDQSQNQLWSIPKSVMVHSVMVHSHYPTLKSRPRPKQTGIKCAQSQMLIFIGLSLWALSTPPHNSIQANIFTGSGLSLSVPSSVDTSHRIVSFTVNLFKRSFAPWGS